MKREELIATLIVLALIICIIIPFLAMNSCGVL